MTTARDLMTADATHCSVDTTAAEAARMLDESNIGAVPVCDASGHLRGVITDRDLAVKIVGPGRDAASVQVGELIDDGEVVTIGADDTIEEAIATMKQHAVRRLPVIDGTTMIGVVSQADIARSMPDTAIGDLVGAISSAPPNG